MDLDSPESALAAITLHLEAMRKSIDWLKSDNDRLYAENQNLETRLELAQQRIWQLAKALDQSIRSELTPAP